MDYAIYIARYTLFSIYLAVSLSSCIASNAHNSSNEPMPIETSSPIQTTAEALTSPPSDPISLIFWIPAEFNLSNNSEASKMLNTRLIEFQENHPGLTIDVRVKISEGSANLLDTLSIAEDAAPSSLPDLILLPSEEMDIAAENQFLLSLDNFFEPEFLEDWFDIAIKHSSFQNEIYGLTFAMDALILNSHPETIDSAPKTWIQALESSEVISYPAADPQSLFTLALYLGQVDSLVDENNEILFDKEKLKEVFQFFDSGSESGLFPHWLSLYDQEDFAWQAFLNGRASMAISWASDYLSSDKIYNASTIPTKDGSPFSLTSAWVLSIPRSNLINTQIAFDLANHLTEDEFLGNWSEVNGFLPPKAKSLTEWQNASNRAFANLILSSAGKIPPKGLIDLVGEKLMQETIKILLDEQNASEATLNILNEFQQN